MRKDFDFYDAAKKIHEIIKGRQHGAVALLRFFEFCEKRFPGTMWRRLAQSDLYAEMARLVVWLRDTLTNESPRGVTAFWFGLFNPYVDGKPACGLYVAGSSKYRKGVEEVDAFVAPKYFPKGRYAASRVLVELYRLATRGKMGKIPEIEYFGCLGFAAIAASHLMRSVEPHLLLGKCTGRAVVVGFDSGDMLKIGTIRKSGFVPHFTPRPKVPKIVPTPSPRPFYRLVDDGQGRWRLDEPWEKACNDLPVSFCTTGKALDVAVPLKSTVNDSLKGEPVDFTFAILETPIVTEEVGRLLDELAPGVLQRLPVRIMGKRGRYEVLNILDVVDCLDLKKSKIISFGKATAEPPAGEEQSVGFITKMVIDSRRAIGHEIFLLAGARRNIMVSRRIKEHLQAERVTGIRFEPA